jgi:hypothetical protein
MVNMIGEDVNKKKQRKEKNSHTERFRKGNNKKKEE